MSLERLTVGGGERAERVRGEQAEGASHRPLCSERRAPAVPPLMPT
jgi:hypothetical protein